jgi:hypothetical protein
MSVIYSIKAFFAVMQQPAEQSKEAQGYAFCC